MVAGAVARPRANSEPHVNVSIHATPQYTGLCHQRRQFQSSRASLLRKGDACRIYRLTLTSVFRLSFFHLEFP